MWPLAVVLITTLATPVQAHTRAELGTWIAEWTAQADVALSPGHLEALEGMQARHPGWLDPPRSTRNRRPQTSPGVEAWRPLVAEFFAADLVDHALCIIRHETTDGNPDKYNLRSGASGLFQHLPKYWADRSAKAGWAGADIFDPRANVAVAAWLQRHGGWGHWTVNPLC